MLIPPFWRGRGKHVPAGIRLTRFHAVLRAAQAFPAYRDRLASANLATDELVAAVLDIDLALAPIEPLPYDSYRSLFRDRRPSWRQRPHRQETRSALLVRYPLARAGFSSCHDESGARAELYSPAALASATTDLYNLARAIENGGWDADWQSNHAVAAFSGMDAGMLTSTQRDELWQKYQVPLFEQFLGTDGRVIAAECEVHDGLHIRPDEAVVECIDGEIVLTSLTDQLAPALRVRSGLSGMIERDVCDCGRREPRVVRLRKIPSSQSSAAVA